MFQQLYLGFEMETGQTQIDILFSFFIKFLDLSLIANVEDSFSLKIFFLTFDVI